MATKFKADEIVIAIEPFVTSCLPSGPFPVAAGQRLRADHPVVKATLDFWVADGTPSDEVGRLRTRIYQRAEADMPVLEARPEQLQPIRVRTFLTTTYTNMFPRCGDVVR